MIRPRESFAAAPADSPPPVGERVLVPVIRDQSAAEMLSVGGAIAAACPGHGVVLGLIEMAPRASAVGATPAIRSRDFLRWISASDHDRRAGPGSRLRLQSRFTSDPVASIQEALLETGSDVVLAEWPAPDARRGHRLRTILGSRCEDAGTSLVVVRPPATPTTAPAKSVMAPLRGGPGAWLALAVACAVATAAGARLTLLHVYDRAHHPRHRRHEELEFAALAHACGSLAPRVVELLADATPLAVLREAAAHDTVVLGASPGLGGPRPLLDGELAALLEADGRTLVVARQAASRVLAA